MVGLCITGKTQIDNDRIGEFVEQGEFYGEWNAREGFWFFEETESNLDELESVLEQNFFERGIKARFEAQV